MVIRHVIRPEAAVKHAAARSQHTLVRPTVDALTVIGVEPRAAVTCRTCGSGIPDAQVSSRLRIGADASNIFADRLRVYVKVDPPPSVRGTDRLRQEVQISLDVDHDSRFLLVGARF